MKLTKLTRKFGRFVWTQMEESGAIMAGTTIDLDQSQTGDRYEQSPVIVEHAHSETHVKARSVRKGRHRHH